MRTLLIVVFAAAIAPSSADSSPNQQLKSSQLYQYSTQAMGTLVSISVWTDEEELAAKAASAAFSEFRRIDALMTSWLETSELSRLNRSAGTAIEVNEELYSVISIAQNVAKKSRGAFDITVGAFKGLWKFGEDKDGTIPKAKDVAARAKRVNFRRVKLLPTNQIRIEEGTLVTLGGIAKGYGMHRAVKIMHELGLVDFIVQAGGDMYASGRKGSRSWKLGIRDPRGERSSTFAIAEIQDATFSTSGDYERYVVIDGVRYHHILDPKSGWPARKSRSVTVVTQSGLLADAWSTALFVMGPKKGMKIVKKTNGMEAVFVDAAGKISVSPGLKKRVQILPTQSTLER